MAHPPTLPHGSHESTVEYPRYCFVAKRSFCVPQFWFFSYQRTAPADRAACPMHGPRVLILNVESCDEVFVGTSRPRCILHAQRRGEATFSMWTPSMPAPSGVFVFNLAHFPCGHQVCPSRVVFLYLTWRIFHVDTKYARPEWCFCI